MRYFYRLKENNEILDYTSFEEGINVPSFIIDQYTETAREIVQVTDGRLMFADEVDTIVEAQAKLNQAKRTKIAEFRQKRDTEEVTVIEYNGHFFDYDENAQKRINIAYQRLESSPSASVMWTTADNNDVPMTFVDFSGLLDAVMFRSNTLHVKYRQLKEAVNACTTVEQVQAICWTESGEA